MASGNEVPEAELACPMAGELLGSRGPSPPRLVEGPRDLMLRAHERILPTDASWARAIAEVLGDYGSDREERLVLDVAETTSLPEDTVAVVLRAAAQGDLYEGIDQDTRRRLLRETYFALWWTDFLLW